MPTNPDGSLRAFTGPEVTAMQIETAGVRERIHPIESRRVNDNVMTRPFFVKWSERFNFIEHVLGDSKLWVDTGPVTKLSRLLPDSTFGRHPDSTQIIADYIEDIRGHPVGIDNVGQFPTYSKALITVHYSQAGFTLSTDAGTTTERDRFTTREPTGQSDIEAFTLPGGAFKFVKAGPVVVAPVPFNISFTRPVRRFSLTWCYLPNDLYTTNGALFRRLYQGTGDGIPWLGTVNKNDLVITSLGTYPAGTLLLEKVSDRLLKSPLSAVSLASLKWDVTFDFAYTPRGWNNLFFWDPSTPANSDYYLVTNDGNFYAPSAVPDKTSLYNVRAHEDLWNPNL